MTSIVMRSAAVAGAAVLVSFLVVLAVGFLSSNLIGLDAWVIGTICPLLIAGPTSAYMFAQGDRLKAAHRELARAHAQLAVAHRRLSDKASRDDMTGMLNRESFFSALESARGKTGGALLIIDADHFKAINDSYGHLTGDEALLLIAGAIKRAMRTGDALGRIGGEEFAAFLHGADEREAARIAERIRTEVELILFRPMERIVRLTVSIGGALFQETMTLPDLMRSADLRLYEAKRRGRNLVIVGAAVSRAA
ncbi:GGDEF domain-containing protein [Mesorhizobium sp. 1M-11]|uniref:GGDEF domain-containing protein n=1 Tax=Mesorhizobium sp. 1M-11 TaxID=1529006 RepID=UPI0006C755D7|nr:GGDEF domain-containing protein [Mesorhizobium sp. 1M-11]